MHQIGQAPSLNRSDRAARQRAELFEVDRLLAHFDQEGVEKILMAELVGGVLGDVGGHVLVDVLQGVPVWPFEVCEFSILLPEISLQDFCRGQESQDSRISVGYGTQL